MASETDRIPEINDNLGQIKDMVILLTEETRLKQRENICVNAMLNISYMKIMKELEKNPLDVDKIKKLISCLIKVDNTYQQTLKNLTEEELTMEMEKNLQQFDAIREKK